MDRHAIVFEVVGMVCVALGARLVGRASGHSGEGATEKTSRAAVRAARVRGSPNLVVPRGHVSLRIQTAPHVHHHCRTQRFPAVLVVAHPLDANRLSDGLRENRCIGGGVIRAVVTIAAGCLDKNHANVRGRDSQELGDGRAQLMRSLRARPDRRGAVSHVGESARWPDRGMQLERPLIRRLESFGGACESGLHVAVISR